jgi:hypothetical protein
VPALDIADDTFVARPPEVVATAVGDPRAWPRWWPDLQLTVTRDRGVKGVQWAVGGALTGSMEVWLEPVPGGTVVHWYLRADAPAGQRRLTDRRLRRSREARVLAWKVTAFTLKDGLEGADWVT